MATTTISCKRIELAYLKKSKVLVKGKVNVSQLSWTDESSIMITANYTEKNKYLKLEYTINNEVNKSYKVHLIEKPSTSGKERSFIWPALSRETSAESFIWLMEAIFLCRLEHTINESTIEVNYHNLTTIMRNTGTY